MYCRNCGNKLLEGEAFCAQCGTKIESEKSAVETNRTTLSPDSSNNYAMFGAFYLFGIILVIISGVLSRIIPLMLDSSGTEMMSEWAFEYQWGTNFYISIYIAMIIGTILMLVGARGKDPASVCLAMSIMSWVTGIAFLYAIVSIFFARVAKKRESYSRTKVRIGMVLSVLSIVSFILSFIIGILSSITV